MPRACAVVRRDNELLVEEVVDGGERVFRPFGATARGDERAPAAIRRAFQEQLGVELADATLLGEFDGTCVFDAEPADRWLHQQNGFTLYDPETSESTRLCWLHRDDFLKYGETLRPDGLLDELDWKFERD